MSELITADAGQLARILESTYPIWNEGLSFESYARWNLVQSRTPWGAAHLKRVALVDGDTIDASAKWYDLEARLDPSTRLPARSGQAGDTLRVLGIGAVFTPQSERGRGRARTEE
jgi:hypothetical protein